jgi:hypothetical protein
MKKVFLFLAVLCTVMPDLMANPFSGGDLTIAQAVNVAGRQRMLSQRMAKAKICKVSGVNAEQSTKELTSSIAIFEETQKNLSSFPSNPKVKAKLDKVSAIWSDYKAALLNDSSKTATTYIVNTNTRMLVLCDEAVQELVAYSATLPKEDDGQAISPELIVTYTNVSGKMRMLSQRFTLYYAIHYADLDKDADEQLIKIGGSIQDGISELLTCEINTTDIDEAISVGLKEWDVIREKLGKNNFADAKAKAMEPAQVFETMNRFLSKMDKVTAMYASLKTK